MSKRPPFCQDGTWSARRPFHHWMSLQTLRLIINGWGWNICTVVEEIENARKRTKKTWAISSRQYKYMWELLLEKKKTSSRQYVVTLLVSCLVSPPHQATKTEEGSISVKLDLWNVIRGHILEPWAKWKSNQPTKTNTFSSVTEREARSKVNLVR